MFSPNSIVFLSRSMISVDFKSGYPPAMINFLLKTAQPGQYILDTCSRGHFPRSPHPALLVGPSTLVSNSYTSVPYTMRKEWAEMGAAHGPLVIDTGSCGPVSQLLLFALRKTLELGVLLPPRMKTPASNLAVADQYLSSGKSSSFPPLQPPSCSTRQSLL